MRICDKCGKPLSKGDWSSHLDLGYSFTYDICAKCKENFLSHISLFFNKSKKESKK